MMRQIRHSLTGLVHMQVDIYLAAPNGDLLQLASAAITSCHGNAANVTIHVVLRLKQLTPKDLT